MDIGTEELSHLEIVGTLARMHLKPLKSVREAAEADPLIAIAGGGGVNLFNSQGNAWTADYLKNDESIKELLVEQLRDILHAEKQLTKALPKMAKSARSAQLKRLFETHLEETEAQAERLNECLRLLGSETLQGHGWPCRRRRGGHAGRQGKGGRPRRSYPDRGRSAGRVL
jgi:bacterioferritin (cytochrome b1)